MAKPYRSLADVNNLLSQRLYDALSVAENPKDLLDLSRAVGQLNASLKGQSTLDDEDEEERQAREEQEAFSSLAEAEIVDANLG